MVGMTRKEAARAEMSRMDMKVDHDRDACRKLEEISGIPVQNTVHDMKGFTRMPKAGMDRGYPLTAKM